MDERWEKLAKQHQLYQVAFFEMLEKWGLRKLQGKEGIYSIYNLMDNGILGSNFFGFKFVNWLQFRTNLIENWNKFQFKLNQFAAALARWILKTPWNIIEFCSRRVRRTQWPETNFENLISNAIRIRIKMH